MSNEAQKPAAPRTINVDSPSTQPAPQQNQGGGKPEADKPSDQQK